MRTKLRECLRDLRLYRVLDPACGSGNFLYLAYRVLKRLERDILLRLRDAGEPHDNLVSAVSPLQLFGIDVLPTAVEIARVTLTLAKELEVLEAEKLSDADGLYLPESPLPLDNLDKQILCADALFTEWPKADAIIGNPPYLGSRYIAQELGYDYANKLYARFPGMPKMADFVTHWFRLAHDALSENGRAGLVATNTVRQGESREASLDYLVKHGGTIVDAVSTQKWSGEAAVSVSIVNWIKGHSGDPKKLSAQIGDAVDSPWEVSVLERIPPTLKTAADTTSAERLAANEDAKVCFIGQNPVNAGFFLYPEEAWAMLKADSRNVEVIFPYMIGRDLVENYGPARWIIDFAKKNVFDARSYPAPFARIETTVMPSVLARAEKEKKDTGKEVTRYTRIAQRWWQFYDHRPGTIKAINSVPRWIAASRVMKRPIYEFVSSRIHADGKLMVFALADDYSFGLIQSSIHWAWTQAQGGTLETRTTYTSDTVFDTFPWPQSPTQKQIRAVADAAVALRKLRRETMQKLGWSLRDLYRSLEEPGDNPLRTAHAALDAAVRAAYGMDKNEDILTHLLALNHACAEREKAGEKITPPGLPLPEDERADYITTDCIRAPGEDDSTAESYATAAHHHAPVVKEDGGSYGVQAG